MKKNYVNSRVEKLEIGENNLAAAAAAVAPIVISQKISSTSKLCTYSKPLTQKHEDHTFLLAAGGGGGYRLINRA